MQRRLAVTLAALLLTVPLLFSPGAAQAPQVRTGDWEVSDEEVVTGGVVVLDGDLTVRRGGKLVLRSATLQLKGESPLEHRILVEKGGALVLEAGSRVMATNPVYQYSFTVEGRLEAVGTASAPVVLRDAGGRIPYGGVYVEREADGVVVRHARFESMTTQGLYVGSDNNLTVTDSHFVGIDGVGVSLAGYLQGEVARNRFIDLQRGLEVRSEQGGLRITGNTVEAAGIGLVAIHTTNLTVEGNVFDGGEQGAVARLEAHARFVGNTFRDYRDAGVIFMEQAWGAVERNRFIAGDNSTSGMKLGYSPSVVAKGNRVEGHSSHGVSCIYSNATLEGNTIRRNGGWGVYLYGCRERLDGNLFGSGASANGEGRIIIETLAQVVAMDAERRGVPGAAVTVRDAHGERVHRSTTNATGHTPWFTVVTYRDVDGEGVSRNPLRFAAEKGDLSSSALYAVQAPRVVALTLAPLPDLVVEGVTTTPREPSEGDDVTVSAVVRNRGAGAANASHLALRVDGGERRLEVPALAPGASATVRAEWTAAAGSHTFVAHADAHGAVGEANEANNGRTLRVTVPQPEPLDGGGGGEGGGGDGDNGTGDGGSPGGEDAGGAAPLPNLRLTADPALTPATGLREGDGVTLTATVTNAGDAAAGAFQVAVVDTGVVVQVVEAQGLAPGESLAVEASLALPPGERVLEVRVDRWESVAEADETDNRGNATVVVAERAAPEVRPMERDEGSREAPGPHAAALLAALAAAALARAGPPRMKRKL